MQLEKLYKQTSSGAIQEWQVSAEGNVVTTKFGQIDSPNIQTTSETVNGKNIGKVNETTDEQQAQLRAKQMHEAKLKKGYTPDLELAKSIKNVLEGVEPMLAFPIEDKEKFVVFPAYAQPKLDGMRCLAVIENGTCTLYSRTQKIINTLPHINNQLQKWSNSSGVLDIILDGELYNHKLKDNFNKLMSLIKRDEPHQDCRDIEYHVYDVVDEKPYHQRTILLDDIESLCPHVEQVEHILVDSRQKLDNYFHYYLEQGYEGAMYRNPNIPYEHKRSTSLLKVKIMQDAEFEIVGINEGKGKLAGKAGALVCKTSSGKEFKAKMVGSIDNLTDYLVNFESKYLGKMLTVQFQGLTPDGIPRFPVGLRIRIEE